MEQSLQTTTSNAESPVVGSGTNQTTSDANLKLVASAQKTVLTALQNLEISAPTYASDFVDLLLRFAHDIGTSDIHLQPTHEGLEVKFRSNGVLHLLGVFSLGHNTSIVSRLKVLSGLLTYQADLPQEGRVEEPPHGREIRVSTFPTLHGERSVLRFFGHDKEFTTLDQLGNLPQVTQQIKNALVETSGAMLVTGPAGSGKSTTLYACLRHLVSSNNGSRSIVSIEDPIEVPVTGVAQSQVDLSAGFDLKTGLRSLMRQDPEVIMVGEIRDLDTAEFAIQASLTGQLLIGTFHSDTSAAAITRLIEMGIEPFLVRSGLISIVTQRLLRVLCEQCARETTAVDAFCGMPLSKAKVPVGCPYCNQTGYSRRAIITEFLDLRDKNVGEAILRRADSRELYEIAVSSGMIPLYRQATDLVRDGTTSPAEVWRVLGTAMKA